MTQPVDYYKTEDTNMTVLQAVLDFLDKPVSEKAPQFKRRDLAGLIVGFVLGALIL